MRHEMPPSQMSANGEHSAVDTLVQQLKLYILERGLKLGDGLPSERELGEMFNAARNTVREAVRILKAYGVVEVRPKVGAVIVNRHMDAALDLFSFQLSFSKEKFSDLQGFRRLIEVGVADVVIQTATQSDLDDLKAINAALLGAKNVQEAALSDFEFHYTLLALAQNQTVLDVYGVMKPMIMRLMETGKQTDGLEGTVEAHATIINAIENRDRLAFQYRMSSHLDFGLKYIDQTAVLAQTT